MHCRAEKRECDSDKTSIFKYLLYVFTNIKASVRTLYFLTVQSSMFVCNLGLCFGVTFRYNVLECTLIDSFYIQMLRALGAGGLTYISLLHIQ